MNLLSIANLKHSCKMTMMRTRLSIHLSIQLKKQLQRDLYNTTDSHFSYVHIHVCIFFVGFLHTMFLLYVTAMNYFKQFNV